MITFQGNRQILKSAQILESKARNTYPHISTSRIRKQIGYDSPDPDFFIKLKKNFKNTRQKMCESEDLYTSVIYALSRGKIGNCTEDAFFTEIIGKINGQNNIYTANIGLSENYENTQYLNHVVAFITNKPVKSRKNFFCKNREAIIIDPWLGVTDFAGSYFAKLKSVYRKVFMQEINNDYAIFSNDNITNELLRTESRTPQEFKTKRKNFSPNITLSLIPYIDKSLNDEKIETLKKTFPELTIKNFKKIKLEKQKN